MIFFMSHVTVTLISKWSHYGALFTKHITIHTFQISSSAYGLLHIFLFYHFSFPFSFSQNAPNKTVLHWKISTGKWGDTAPYIIVLETIQCQLQMYRQYKCVYTYFEMWQILERKKIITHLVAFFYYNYKTIPVISHITEVGVCPPERIPNTTLCSSMTIYDMSTTCCLRTHKKESCSISLFTSWADIDSTSIRNAVYLSKPHLVRRSHHYSWW